MHIAYAEAELLLQLKNFGRLKSIQLKLTEWAAKFMVQDMNDK